MGATDLERVRQVLLGTEFEALLELRADYEDDEKFSAHVAAVLAEAMRQRAGQDDSIANVLAPLIDRAISSSINQDPQKLAESLYPIMGPAIRKSISETLQQMLENFNQLLEHSLTPQSLRWRFDAWRTGRSYSELMLLNTLEYQVEQVFLIHRETSLLVQHVYSEYSERKDPDMVSSMFSAIQDFIEDSFSVSEGDVLDTLKLGELTVVIQRGPLAVLAAVVRGRVPDTLRTQLMSTLESLHRLKRSSLVDYSGDPEEFAETESDLRQILDIKLKSDEESSERKIPWFALIVIAIVLGGFGYLRYLDNLVNIARSNYLATLEQIPGVVVIDSAVSDDAMLIEAMIDADAEGVEAISYDPQMFRPELTRFSHVSLDPVIVQRRAERVLQPPESVSLSVVNSVLIVTGEVPLVWYQQMERSWPAATGIASVDSAGLVVIDTVAVAMAQNAAAIESITFAFEKEGADVLPDDPQLPALASAIEALQELALARGQQLNLDVIGYTDESGSRLINQQLAIDRALSLRDALVAGGVDQEILHPASGFDYDGQGSSERKAILFVRLE